MCLDIGILLNAKKIQVNRDIERYREILNTYN